MKTLLATVFVFCSCFMVLNSSAQIFCKTNGNVIIYSNYDGGYLSINVDEHIPNLKIGVTTYEDCEITISGTYSGDVTEVIYAGYQGDNQHCQPSPATTSVNGVAGNIVTLLLYPTATWSNPDGYPYIICNYQCDSSGYQGGCNTADQIAHYFLTQFGGLLYYHFTQYGCWAASYNVSDGGNCCVGENLVQAEEMVLADFVASSDSVCEEETIAFTNNSYNSYPGAPEFNWDFGDGSPDVNTTDASHGYALPGSYVVTLTITDSSGVATDTQTMVITVLHCATSVSGFGLEDWLSIQPNPAHDEIVFSLPQQLSLPATIQLIDATGRICSVNRIESGYSGKIVLGVEDLPSGIYLLSIKGNGYLLQKKILLE